MSDKEKRESLLEQINALTYELLMTFNPGEYPQMLLLDISDKVKEIKLELAK